MNRQHGPRNVKAMDQMQTSFPTKLLFRLRDPLYPIVRLPLPAPQPRKVQDAAAQVQKLVLRHRSLVVLVVLAVPVEPRWLVRNLPYPRATELDVVRLCYADVRRCIKAKQDSTGILGLEREGDQDSPGGRQIGEEVLVRICGVEFELDSAVASRSGGGGITYLLGSE